MVGEGELAGVDIPCPHHWQPDGSRLGHHHSGIDVGLVDRGEDNVVAVLDRDLGHLPLDRDQGVVQEHVLVHRDTWLDPEPPNAFLVFVGGHTVLVAACGHVREIGLAHVVRAQGALDREHLFVLEVNLGAGQALDQLACIVQGAGVGEGCRLLGGDGVDRVFWGDFKISFILNGVNDKFKTLDAYEGIQ